MDSDPYPANDIAGVLCNAVPALSFQAPENWAAWSFLILIAVICLLLSAFVSGSEIAFFSLTSSDLDQIEENEDNKWSKAKALISNSERLLATILIANNLVNITMVVVLTYAINQVMEAAVWMEFLIQSVFLTFLLLLFGEIFPKLVARGRTMKWVRMAQGGVMAFYKQCSPLSKAMVRSVSVVNKVVTKRERNVTADELEKALEISDVKEGDEKEMLEGILTFGEKEAREIMISRVDVTAIEYHESWEHMESVIIESGFSRIPVYDTTRDNIRGILYSKDLLPWLDSDNKPRWQSLIREAYFVPESRMIDDLLEDFRRKKIHIAIVIDEYGCTQGIVTLEDVIEQIVGDIDDEYDQEDKMFRLLSPDHWVFDAKIPLDDFCHVTDVEEEETLGDIGDAETLAGLLLEMKGDFPALREKLQRGPFTFEVMKIERHRIMEVRVVKKEPVPDKEKE